MTTGEVFVGKSTVSYLCELVNTSGIPVLCAK